jgi:hypothetical protein
METDVKPLVGCSEKIYYYYKSKSRGIEDKSFDTTYKLD